MNASPPAKRFWITNGLFLLCLVGGGNVFLPLFVVPKFEQIFRDALGSNAPLPGITLFIIHARLLLALIGVAWPIAGIVASWRRLRAAIWIIASGNLFFFVLVVVSVVALFGPISGGIIVGMSDAPIDSAQASH